LAESTRHRRRWQTWRAPSSHRDTPGTGIEAKVFKFFVGSWEAFVRYVHVIVMSHARSANELACELQEALNESLALEQLSLTAVTEGETCDFSIVEPPSVGSSTGRTTLSSRRSSAVPHLGSVDNIARPSGGGPGVGGAPGWRPQGEFSPLTPQRKGGVVFSLYQGGGWARGPLIHGQAASQACCQVQHRQRQVGHYRDQPRPQIFMSFGSMSSPSPDYA